MVRKEELGHPKTRDLRQGWQVDTLLTVPTPHIIKRAMKAVAYCVLTIGRGDRLRW